ncbi:hypothetical protein D3C81_1602240 [compost metagenome]
MVKRTVGHIALAKLLEARLFAHEVYRAARVRRAKQGGVGATQNLDALISEWIFAYAAHRTQGQAVTVSGGLEAADLEIVIAVIRTVEVSDHAGRVLQRLFRGADAALLHFLVGNN